MDFDIAVQLILNSIIAGGIYALVALGYTMVYGILKFINFAHGEVFMIGAYTAYVAASKLPSETAWYFAWFLSILIVVFLYFTVPLPRTFQLLKKYKIVYPLFIVGIAFLVAKALTYPFYYLGILQFPIWLAVLPAMLVCCLLGFCLEKIGYRPLRSKERLSLFITAIGFSIVLQALMLLIFGSEIRSFERAAEQGLSFLGASITPTQVLIIFISILVMVLLQLFLKFTKTGKAMRAVTDNMLVANVVGINTDKMISTVFIIGSLLAAIAGTLVGVEQNLNPSMGISVGIKAFTAAVVGGIGNIYGALWGGYAIGFAENIGIWFIPSGYKDAIAFVILIVMLLFKPTGFFGEKGEEAVRA
ncbi:branched-chain amino acid ABC transporter permease [Candidatus Woesearchaeota archaeon]|nr:branched-chain amino acid ABC transporter permease [Candidatus Woesearchaeota archaeon]